jgi:hypothetical protein
MSAWNKLKTIVEAPHDRWTDEKQEKIVKLTNEEIMAIAMCLHEWKKRYNSDAYGINVEDIWKKLQMSTDADLHGAKPGTEMGPGLTNRQAKK